MASDKRKRPDEEKRKGYGTRGLQEEWECGAVAEGGARQDKCDDPGWSFVCGHYRKARPGRKRTGYIQSVAVEGWRLPGLACGASLYHQGPRTAGDAVRVDTGFRWHR